MCQINSYFFSKEAKTCKSGLQQTLIDLCIHFDKQSNIFFVNKYHINQFFSVFFDVGADTSATIGFTYGTNIAGTNTMNQKSKGLIFFFIISNLKRLIGGLNLRIWFSFGSAQFLFLEIRNNYAFFTRKTQDFNDIHQF